MTNPSPTFNHLPQPPIDCQCLFAVWPPVVSPGGLTADHVVAGIPMVSWMGPEYGIQVFASDAYGRVIDWLPVWDAYEDIDLSPADWPADWVDVVCGAFQALSPKSDA